MGCRIIHPSDKTGRLTDRGYRPDAAGRSRGWRVLGDGEYARWTGPPLASDLFRRVRGLSWRYFTDGETAMHLLSEMLTYQRPAHSPSERAFIRRFLDQVPGMVRDDFGNRWLRIGARPTTLFCAHTDSVHATAGRQRLREDRRTRRFYKDDGQPLGADDATGCWLLLQLIAHGVPGLYVFHREEETGGDGSDWIARETPGVLAGIERAIAFDRRGTGDVITHQCRVRTCSTDFAQALAAQLGLGFAPCAEGVFTDTAHYAGLIPECTNLSIGYEHAHTGMEYQDYGFLEYLLPALLRVEWAALPVERVCAPFSRRAGFADRLTSADWLAGLGSAPPAERLAVA